MCYSLSGGKTKWPFPNRRLVGNGEWRYKSRLTREQSYSNNVGNNERVKLGLVSVEQLEVGDWHLRLVLVHHTEGVIFHFYVST